MFFLYIVVTCIPFIFASEGRTVQGIIGSNMSLSWTFSNTKRDSFSINHNSTDLLMVWPPKNFVVWRVKNDRLQVYLNTSTYVNLTITVSISNISEQDAGTYNLVTRWEPVNFIDSISQDIKAGPNKISYAPNFTMIHAYSGLSLSCLTDCYPICSWNRTSLDPSSSGLKFISAEKALYYQNVTLQGAVKYSCRVQNQTTGVSFENFTWLEIVYGPDKRLFNLSDNKIELEERDSVTISCYADCVPRCQMDWIGSHVETPINSAELKIVNDTRDCNYTCRAMNPRKNNTTISDTIYVIVKSGADIDNSTMKTRPEGSKFVFDFLILVYIILGFGCILVGAGCICCLRKLRTMLTYRQTIEQHSNDEAVEIEYI